MILAHAHRSSHILHERSTISRQSDVNPQFCNPTFISSSAVSSIFSWASACVAWLWQAGLLVNADVPPHKFLIMLSMRS